MAKDFIQAIPLTSIDSSTFTGNYKAINSTGLPNGCSLIRITNDSNRDVLVSYDGVLDHDYIVAGDKLELNLQANSLPTGCVAQLKQGTVVHVAAAAGTGYVYLAGYYSPKS